MRMSMANNDDCCYVNGYGYGNGYNYRYDYSYEDDYGFGYWYEYDLWPYQSKRILLELKV